MKDPESKAKASKAVMAAFDNWYEKIPGFEDVFTETSFYIFAFVFTLARESARDFSCIV